LTSDLPKFSCIILAGGLGKRMQGNDKGLVDYMGRPLIEHVLNRISPQVSDIVISANRNLPHYRSYGYRVIPDSIEGFAGPLSGIASALPACTHHWVLVTPCDMPRLPRDLLSTMYDARGNVPLVAIEAGGRLQLVFLMQRDLLPAIITFLSSGQHRVMTWLQSQPHKLIKYNSAAQAFCNFNTLIDLET
jgi:molybdopterin-guanine dinucleotide biosynthesis protein A